MNDSDTEQEMDVFYYRRKEVLAIMSALIIAGVAGCIVGVKAFLGALEISAICNVSLDPFVGGFDPNGEFSDPGASLLIEHFLSNSIWVFAAGLILILEFCNMFIMRRMKDRLSKSMIDWWRHKVSIMAIIIALAMFSRVLPEMFAK